MANLKNNVFADFLNRAIRDMICNDFPEQSICNDLKGECSIGSIYEIPEEIEKAAKEELPGFTFPEGGKEISGNFEIHNSEYISEYISNRNQIKDLFGNPFVKQPSLNGNLTEKQIFGNPAPNQPSLNGNLTIMLIMHRLALIDLYYGTNVNRMRQFGLIEIANQLWILSIDAQGNHTNAELARKAIDFVANTSPTHQLQVDLFSKNYGYIVNAGGITTMDANSLLSKYLFFLLDDTTNPIGFPIYDSIVKDLSVKIAKKLGIPQAMIKTKEMSELCILLKEIVTILEQRDPVLWNQQTALRSKFALLDYFLWRVGKAGRFNFSLLITHKELLTHSKTLSMIKALQKYASANKIYSQIAKAKMVMCLKNLPPRFLMWYLIYSKI